MAITTGDGYIAAAKQIIPWVKTSTTTTTATARFTTCLAQGNPGTGTLAGAVTPSGGLCTAGSNGSPTINAFGGGATGYLTRVQWANTVAGRLDLFDKIYAVNVTTAQLGTLQTLTLSSQPSILARTPDGAGNGLRIHVEITTAMAATATTIQVTYTNQAGTTGRTSQVSSSLSGLAAGRWVELGLAAGDSGVQKIESVIIGGATNASGALNVIIVRPLWTNGTRIVNGNGVDGIDRTGMPVVYATSALVLTTLADSTSSGVPDLNIEIANG